VFINTAGIGIVDDRADIRPQRAAPGDVVIVSGDIGVHGVAVMSCREGLEFATTVASDTAPLHDLVAAMLATGADLHVLRDPTRGGVAASLNEIATAAGVGVEITERALPIPQAARDACGLLGLDPLYVANEGKLLAFVAPDDADRVLAAMRAHEHGRDAAVIGTCVDKHPGMLVARTGLGGTRVIDLPLGEQLPRIC
jgi:hydrogenase expression/formation protein HypE